MGFEMIALGTGLFAGATGVPQYFEQKKAARRAERAQNKANATERAAAQVENARRRRRALAQARMAQAQNTANQGAAVQYSSALSGVQSSLSTQFGANVGAQNQMIGNQAAVQGYQQQAASALRKGQERAGMWDVAGNLAQMGMTAFGGGIGGGTSGGYLNSARAGSQQAGYTGNQYQTWLNNQ